MPQIFISYSHTDRDFAQRIKTDLEDLKADLWIDRGRIRAADSWRDEIHQALRDCEIMLLIISPHSMNSEVVKKEYSYFLEERKTIIPILWRLAEVPFGIQDLHYVDFRTPYYNDPFVHLYDELVTRGVKLEPIAPCYNPQIHLPDQPHLPLSPTDMIRTARHDLWIGGIALDTTINQNAEALANALRKNITVRLYTIGLHETLLNETGTWLGLFEGSNWNRKEEAAHRTWFEQHGYNLTPEGFQVGMRVRSTLLRVCQLAQQLPTPNKLQVKTLRYRPVWGYLIVDPNHSRTAQMTVMPYFYQLGQTQIEPPGTARQPDLFYLSGHSHDETELRWFKLYAQDFERLWWRGADQFDCESIE